MPELIHAIGYLSGIYFIQPHIDETTLIRTASVIHGLNALLCYIIATKSGRGRVAWTLAGLVLGVWAVAPLFILVERKPSGSDNNDD
ncbi:MAG: hypothetical protein GTO40_30425 [Deltaproteobacteria bacterium]|nr:hypothetical protein [Deltaproteobacteria bacterium]